MIDPLRDAIRRRALWSGSGAVIVLCLGAWSVWPQTSEDELPDSLVVSEGQGIPDRVRDPLELVGFETAVLWPPDALPDEENDEAAEPEPLPLRLVAILQEPGGLRAALADPNGNELRLARAGDAVGGFHVETISAQAVEVRRGDRVQRVALEEGPRTLLDEGP